MAKTNIISKTIAIQDMHCVACSAGIENALKETTGIVNAVVNFTTKKAYVDFDENSVSLEQIEEIITSLGYTPSIDGEPALPQGDYEAYNYKNKFLFSLIFAVPLLYVTMGQHMGLPKLKYTPGVMAFIQFMLTTYIMNIGIQFYKRGLVSFAKTKIANMDTLIALSTGSAYLYSFVISALIWRGSESFTADDLYFETTGLLLMFMLLGKWLEEMAHKKTANAIERLVDLQAKTAVVIRNGAEKEVDIEEIIKGDIILVKPGQKVPVDGTIIEGNASIDQSMISGESMPVDKKTGDFITGATINTAGVFKFRAEKLGEETFLAQIVKTVQDAQKTKPDIAKTADKISAVFVPSIVILAVICLVMWMSAGKPFIFSLNIFIAVLIIACPCALGLAVPAAVIVASGIAAKNGILIKNSEVLETLEKIDAFVFDKTGTITKGRPRVTSMAVSDNESEDYVLSLAASAEKMSEHPLSKAITEYAKEKNARIEDVSDFKIINGKGVEAKIGRSVILAGTRELLIERNVMLIGALDKKSEDYYYEGNTVVWVAKDNNQVGLIAVADEPQENAKKTVSQLMAMGKRVLLVSGDCESTVRAVASKVGIQDIFYGVLPEGKAKIVNNLKNDGYFVAMIGDGINDAPALAYADVSMAIGTGTDIAIESSQIVFIKNDISAVLDTVKIGELALKKIKQNLFLAFAYNVLAIPIAAGILYPFTGFLLNPVVAGICMSLSSVSVIFNSLSINRFKTTTLSSSQV
jgi:P-type Cu+ transporter